MHQQPNQGPPQGARIQYVAARPTTSGSLQGPVHLLSGSPARTPATGPQLIVARPAYNQQTTMPGYRSASGQQVIITGGQPVQLQAGGSAEPQPQVSQQRQQPFPSTSAQSAPAPSTSSRGPGTDNNAVLTRKRLDDLVREVDPHEQLDDDVKDFLLETTDAFIDGVMQDACRLAKHRGSDHVDASDLLLVLEKNHNMWIPGFSRDQAKPYKKAHTTEAHRQRLALIRKAMKKV